MKEYEGLKRITRNEAKNLFNNDIDVKIVPCKVNPLEWDNWFKKSDNEGNFNYVVKQSIKHVCNSDDGLTLAYYKEA